MSPSIPVPSAAPPWLPSLPSLDVPTLTATGEFGVTELAWALLMGSIVVVLALAVVRISSRSAMPNLLLYLGIGVALSGLGVTFDSAALGQVLGYAALILILAEGGLTTSWSSIRNLIGPALVLSTIGVAVSIGLVGVAAHVLLNLSWTQSLLIGAILSSTDAAAVFSVLRSISLPRRLTGLLEAESGFNDAPVVLVVVALADRLVASGHESPIWQLPLTALAELTGGAIIGLLIGVGGGWLMRRVAGSSSTLFAIGLLSVAVLAYAVAALAHTSGFIATFLCALVLGNSRLPHRTAVHGFATAIGWIAQIGLFVMLGLLATPLHLTDNLFGAIVIGLALLWLARPVSVFVSMTPFRMPWREQLFLSWAGLRGAVPVVLATVPLNRGVPGTKWIFDMVFVLVVINTAVQAPLMPWVARRLGLVEPERARGVVLDSTPLEGLDAEVIQVSVGPASRLHGVEVFELRLPRKSKVALLVRAGETIVPTGITKLRHGDELLVVTTASARAATEDRLVAVSRGGRLAGWGRDGKRDGNVAGRSGR